MVDLKLRRFEVGNGLIVAADEGGNSAAPTVVLTHGGGQTRHAWGNAMQDLLSQGYHVINLDARGHGDSAWATDGDYSLQRMAADIGAVVDELGRAPVLVGASMGGMAALYLAGTAAPSLLSGLVMVDVVPRVEAAGAQKIGRFMRAYPDGFASMDEVADAVAAYRPGHKQRSDSSGLMKNLRQCDNGRWYWHWDPSFAQGVNLLDSDVTELMLAAARNVRVPALLIRGLKSDVVGDPGVEELRQALPGLKTLDLAEAGHMIAGDKNDVFSCSLKTFLRELPEFAI